MTHRFNTKVIHAGQEPDPLTGAIMPPIYQTSTYVQSSPGVHKGYEYARTHNRTRELLEACVASLEGAKHGIAFSSGMAATDACMHLLETGDHVLYSDDLYGGTHRLFHQVFSRHGLEFTHTDMTSIKNVEPALKKNTRCLWLETPTNPLLKIIDIAAVSACVKKAGCLMFVDNTFLSPYFQNPLALGADVVVHSTTKFINGHSDVIGGIVLTNNDELAERFRFLQNSVGGVPAPFDCWLTLRGVKTLALRMQRHMENAKVVASFLENHPLVERVLFPGLASHEQRELIERQMKGHGGMISLYLKTDLDGTRRFLEATKLFSLAESLGGVESLIEHPGIMTHASLPENIRAELGITDNFIRLSVGIEDKDDLLDDLKAAFAALGG